MLPEIGPTAKEVVAALSPMLQETVSKEELRTLTGEIGRLANELGRMNGTVRNLCEWRAGVNERHRQEDAQATQPVQPAQSAQPEQEHARRLSDIKEIINLVLGWALRFAWAGAALATGLSLAKIAEVVFK